MSFLRGEREGVDRVDALLADGRAATCGPVVAELLSGCRSRGEYRRLEQLLSGLSWVDDPVDRWPRVADARYRLARNGFQVSTIDVLIAIIAEGGGCPLLTRDSDFDRIREAVPFELIRF